MTSEDFKSALIEYLAEISESKPASITEDTDLIDAGIIDSFAITQLLLFIEDKLNFTIDIDDPLLDSIRTVRSMDLSFNGIGEEA